MHISLLIFQLILTQFTLRAFLLIIQQRNTLCALYIHGNSFVIGVYIRCGGISQEGKKYYCWPSRKALCSRWQMNYSAKRHCAFESTSPFLHGINRVGLQLSKRDLLWKNKLQINCCAFMLSATRILFIFLCGFRCKWHSEPLHDNIQFTLGRKSDEVVMSDDKGTTHKKCNSFRSPNNVRIVKSRRLQ